MEQFSWWAVFLGVICPSGNYVGDKSSGRQFSLGTTSRGILSECSYFWSNCPGAILRGHSSRAIIWRATVLGGNCQGWNFLRGQLSLRAIVWGGNNPETDYPGSRFPREQLSGHHLQPNKLQKKANFNPIH